MSSLLLPLPVLAILLAAVDALLVRWSHAWRAPDVRLFFHAYFLWAAFGLLALLPARLTLALWDRRVRPTRGFSARPTVALLAWMVLPVLAESVLDRHTSLVGFAGLSGARPWLELGAALLGGAGLLALGGRWFSAWPGLRTAAVGVGLALALGLFLPEPRSAESGAVRAGAVPRPNLLLLVWDTCRSDRLQPYGAERGTSPGLARLAQESILFENSLSASTFTFTSHLSLLTGVHPVTHGAQLLDMRFDPARAQSVAALLAAQGYRTGAFVGTDVLSGRTGIDAGFETFDDAVDPAVCDTYAWQFVHDLQALAARFVPALRFDGLPHWIQDFQRPGAEVLQHALAWIRSDDRRPWFCFVNLYDVHWPYLPEGEGRARFVRPYDGPVDGYLFRSDHWRPGYRMDAADKAHVNDLYEGEVYDLDRDVTRFLERLRLERGGTAVVMTADHGEGLGEQETWNHDDVREPQTRVPLLVRLPQPDPKAARVRAPVSGVDVAPTLLALAGLEPPASMEGRDLLHSTPEDGRERWVDDRDHVSPEDYRCALYQGDFKLVRFGVGAAARYELYDLAQEPAGFRDVQAEHRALCATLVARMEERWSAARVLAPQGDSGAVAAGLKALGYGGE